MYTYDEIQSAAATKTQTGLKDKGVKTDDKAFPSKTEEVEATEATVRQDDFTSGHYVIGGIEYIYSDGDQALTQRLTLLRREWPTRANNL